MRFRKIARAALLLASALVFTAATASAQTLQAVKSRGQVVCGVSQGIPGFSAKSAAGEWSGFDVDFCRALAAAIFDDPGKVSYVPLSAGERFAALAGGKIDVLSRNSTWTMSRETELGLVFPAVTYYDGQGFMLRHALKIESAHDLKDTTICTQSGTTTEHNLAEFFSANGMQYKLVLVPTIQEMIKDYESGRCSVMTTDASQLHAIRAGLAKPADHDILADIISKEPLGPAVKQGDFQWFNIVKWTAFALLDAEELGVNSRTYADALKSDKPDVKRLLGNEGNYGEQLGLTKDWAARIIKHVGSYAEIYDRNVGTHTPLGIPRGMNELWSAGGILYAPPIR
jgi:general L-amino acid transport system substrate-binding protein